MRIETRVSSCWTSRWWGLQSIPRPQKLGGPLPLQHFILGHPPSAPCPGSALEPFGLGIVSWTLEVGVLGS